MAKFLLILFFITFDLKAEVTKSEFSAVIAVIHKNFHHLSLRENRKLKFYTNYQSDWAQAFARRWDDDEIHIYGGFAKILNASVDSLALIICHELGHLYAGAPFSNKDSRLSVEGMADYWASSVCMPKIINELPESPSPIENEYLLRCANDQNCARNLRAAMIISSHFAKNGKEEKPSFDTFDPTIVEKTLKTHPSAQCRLDTFVAGVFGLEKPRCWMGDAE